MDAQTRNVLALAALIVAAGVALVEATRDPIQASPRFVIGGTAEHANAGADAAMDAAALTAVEYPLAEKGIGCRPGAPVPTKILPSSARATSPMGARAPGGLSKRGMETPLF